MTAPTAAPPLPAVLCVPEVRDILGVSLATTYEWINAGIIPSFRVGRRVYVRRAELERWLAGDWGQHGT